MDVAIWFQLRAAEKKVFLIWSTIQFVSMIYLLKAEQGTVFNSMFEEVSG